MAVLSPLLRHRYFDQNGNPLVGGKLYSYEAGTTTPKITYSDRSAATPNTNPIILDSSGECDIWLGSGNYKLVLTTASDVIQWTVDNVVSPADPQNLGNYLDLNENNSPATEVGSPLTDRQRLYYRDGFLMLKDDAGIKFPVNGRVGSKGTTPQNYNGWLHFNDYDTGDATQKISARGLAVYDSVSTSWFSLGGVFTDGTSFTLTNGGTINLYAPKAQNQIMYINGTGAGFVTSVNTMQAGSYIGQVVHLVFNTANTTDFVTLSTGGNLRLRGDSQCNLSGKSSITFVWGFGNVWVELARTEAYRAGKVSITTYTPSSNGIYATGTGNSITLPGTSTDQYEVIGTAFFSNNTTSPAYLAVEAGLFSANGANTGTRPTNVSDIDSVGSNAEYTTRIDTSANGNSFTLHTRPGRFAGGQTIYLVQYAFATTIANARYSGQISWRKV